MEILKIVLSILATILSTLGTVTLVLLEYLMGIGLIFVFMYLSSIIIVSVKRQIPANAANKLVKKEVFEKIIPTLKMFLRDAFSNTSASYNVALGWNGTIFHAPTIEKEFADLSDLYSSYFLDFVDGNTDYLAYIFKVVPKDDFDEIQATAIIKAIATKVLKHYFLGTNINIACEPLTAVSLYADTVTVYFAKNEMGKAEIAVFEKNARRRFNEAKTEPRQTADIFEDSNHGW